MNRRRKRWQAVTILWPMNRIFFCSRIKVTSAFKHTILWIFWRALSWSTMIWVVTLEGWELLVPNSKVCGKNENCPSVREMLNNLWPKLFQRTDHANCKEVIILKWGEYLFSIMDKLQGLETSKNWQPHFLKEGTFSECTLRKNLGQESTAKVRTSRI